MTRMHKELGLLFEYSKSKFTATDKKIAEYFLARRPVKSIEGLASEIGVSSASITRFCHKINVNNFKELLFIYQEQLDRASPPCQHHDIQLQSDYIDILQQLNGCLDRAVIEQITQAISRAPVIHLFGTGFSALAGADFKFRFSRLGKYVEVVQDIPSMQMYQGILTPKNVVIVLSLNAQNKEIGNIIKALTSRNIETFLICANRKSKFIHAASATLLTASLGGEERTGMISAQFPMLMAIDHLYSHYVHIHRETIKNWVLTQAPFEKG